MISEKLFARPLPVQIPIGVEDTFEGAIDLITMKALYWTDPEDRDIDVRDIPEGLLASARSSRASMIESLSENDDLLMEKYLEGLEPSEEELKNAVRNQTIGNLLFPVFCGSALKKKGVQSVLDAIVDYLPSPKDIKPVEGHDVKDHDVILTREASDKEPFSALVFKIMSDSYIGKLTYLRVYSGHIKSGDSVLNLTMGKKERINRFLRMHANDREEISEIYTGDIVAVVGLKNARTGDTLCDENSPILLEKMIFPEPVISVAIEPKTKADQEKLMNTLARLEDEDPTFRVNTNAETGQLLISGMGELHLDIIVDRLMREFNIQANVGKPVVTYKETVTESAQARHVFEKVVAGKDQFGDVTVLLGPAERGAGFVFVNSLPAGVLPGDCLSAIEAGFRDSVEAGVIAGYKMVDVRAELKAATFDENKSVNVAYRIAANQALKEAARKGNPALMEPIMKTGDRMPAMSIRVMS
jgi:elongation factor G